MYHFNIKRTSKYDSICSKMKASEDGWVGSSLAASFVGGLNAVLGSTPVYSLAHTWLACASQKSVLQWSAFSISAPHMYLTSMKLSCNYIHDTHLWSQMESCRRQNIPRLGCKYSTLAGDFFEYARCLRASIMCLSPNVPEHTYYCMPSSR